MIKKDLDRKDNNKGYEPGNLRWVNRSIQKNNQRLNSRSKTGYTGVYYKEKTDNYFSCLEFNKKMNYFGTFSTLKEAVEARNKYIIDNNLEKLGYKIQFIS